MKKTEMPPLDLGPSMYGEDDDLLITLHRERDYVEELRNKAKKALSRATEKAEEMDARFGALNLQINRIEKKAADQDTDEPPVVGKGFRP